VQDSGHGGRQRLRGQPSFRREIRRFAKRAEAAHGGKADGFHHAAGPHSLVLGCPLRVHVGIRRKWLAGLLMRHHTARTR
jgi:hypothetical protein